MVFTELTTYLSMSSAKNKPILETTFQTSIYKTKSYVKSQKCTYGIVYIFTPHFRYFTEIRSYYVNFYICDTPVTVRKLKKTPILFLFSVKPSRQGFCTIDTFLMFDLHTAHMHYITHISEVILSLQIGS